MSRRTPPAAPSRAGLTRTLTLVLSAALGVPAVALVPDTTPVSARAVVAPQQVRLAASATAASLGSRVAAALRGSTAVTVSAAVDVDGLGSVYRLDAGHRLPPASTQKSFTTSAALLALPRTTVFRTEVVTVPSATASATSTVVPSLTLVAGGDAYLTSAGLRALAHSVRTAGVRTVTGDLRLDDTRYDRVRRNVGWKTSYVPGESGPLSAMSLDRNTWRRDAAFLRDPALPAAVRFRDMLKAEGVAVKGRVVRGNRPAVARTVAVHDSAPLPAVVTRIMKNSDNFAAELLLKEVGHAVLGTGSSAAGVEAVKAVLQPRGVVFGTATDGSGLSSRDRQTPAGQLTLLGAVGASPAAADLRSALPRACVDGTLRRRMCGTAAAGNATAKTGTLSGVTTLAGYVTTRSGRVARFAFQLTGVKNSAKGRAAMDRAVVVLASSTD